MVKIYSHNKYLDVGSLIFILTLHYSSNLRVQRNLNLFKEHSTYSLKVGSGSCRFNVICTV